MRTLIKMARDIYPHDRLADRFYAVAMKGYDAKAATDPQARTMIEQASPSSTRCARKQHGVAYVESAGRRSASPSCAQIESEPFFQNVRGGLVVTLYNQKEVWPIFGYEGESASQGGYINRGFDDIAWL